MERGRDVVDIPSQSLPRYAVERELVCLSLRYVAWCGAKYSANHAGYASPSFAVR